MFSNRIDSSFPLALIQVLARLTSIASIALLLMLFVGESFEPSKITANEWAGLVFFPIGVVAGMVIAWRNEGVGAVVTLGSLVGFYLVWGYLMRNHIGGWAFIAFASPSLLFLAHWLLRGDRERHTRVAVEARHV